MTSSLIPPRYSAASPRTIRGRRLPLAAGERMSAPSAPGSTASAAIIRPFPPSAPPERDTYNAEMQRSVQAFQRIFQSDPRWYCRPATWNKIAYLCSGMRLAELGGEDIPLRPSVPAAPCAGAAAEKRCAWRSTSCGSLPCTMIRFLHHHRWLLWPGHRKRRARLPKMQGLTVDGIIGPATLECPVRALPRHHPNHRLARTYRGTPLKSGSAGIMSGWCRST